MDGAAILAEYGACVWLLEVDERPHLIYATQNDLLADTKNVTWTMVDSDSMSGYIKVRDTFATYYATPWPVHSFGDKNDV